MFNAARYAAAMFVVGVTFSGSVAGAQGATSVVKPISIGISGGASIPMSDLANGTGGFTGVNTGYNVTGSLAIGLPVVPFGLRGDVAYNGFGGKNVTFAQLAGNGGGAYNADARIVSVTANVVFPLHLPAPILEPYLIGGIGDYNVRLSPTTGGSTSQSNFGFNVGAGMKLPLVLFSTFVEARYNRVNQNGGSMAFMPITVGVMF